LDLAIAKFGTSEVAILLGDGHGAFGTAASFAAGGLWVDAGDFNGDHNLDLATNVGIMLGDGHGSFGALMNLDGTAIPNFVLAADFNGDGKLDLTFADGGFLFTTDRTGAADTAILLGNGDGTFALAPHFAAGTNPQAIARADFNSDGNLDLAVANSGSNN